MPRRYYSSTAVETTLTSNVSNSATTLPVASTSGFPGSTPYTLILDEGTVNEEIVTVTGVASLNLTATRGVDGTTAVSHSNGATVKHGVSARDFDETNSHVNDNSTDVHTQYVTKALVDAKGDLVTATADNTPARLAVGSNGQVLVAASGESTGLIWQGPAEVIGIAVSDEETALTTGTAKVTFRMPFAMTLTAVRASLSTASTSGLPTFDINEGGTTILSTKLTIDANEKTSTTAATAAVISDSALADDAEITIDIDVAGTGAKGAKVYLIGRRA
jgi:hypothetical protein